MIKVKNLSFRYRGKSHIFRDFSFSAEAGQIYGLLGANGTGKSTLLRLLCGVLAPEKGEVEVLGHRASTQKVAMLCEVAVLPEEVGLPNITTLEYVRITAPFYPHFDHEFMTKALAAFEVNPDVRLNTLSMGGRKKVCIAFAMACGTSLLLLDEPTNGLDITSKAVFRRLLAEWATPSRTAIISTHQVKDVENLLDHIVIIDHNGSIVDASTYEISHRLKFAVESSAEGALYSQPTLGGWATVSENTTNCESNIDLELLFGAATNHREEIKSILNPSTK